MRPRVLVLLATILLLAGCSKTITRETGSGPVELTPSFETRYTLFSSRIEHHVRIVLPAVSTQHFELDVLLLFDRTGSMHSVIKSVGSTAQQLVNSIQQVSPKTRFAVASLADYAPLYSKDFTDMPWELVADFQTDSTAISRAITSIPLGNGGDAPESYVRALWEASRLDWRKDATKLVVMFGDSTAHDPDPGPDGVLGTADDLTMHQALTALRARGVKVAGFYCEPRSLSGTIGRWISRLFGAGTEAEMLYGGMWGEIARQTDGLALRLADPERVVSLLQAAVVQTMLPQPVIREVPAEPGEERNLVLEGAPADDLSDTARPEFRLHIAIKPDTPAGAYLLPLVAEVKTGGERLEIPFRVRVVTGWYNFPLWLLLPLLITIFLLALWLWWLLGKKYVDRYYSVLGRGPPRRMRVKVGFMVLHWLLWSVVVLAAIGVLIYLFDGPVISQWLFWR